MQKLIIEADGIASLHGKTFSKFGARFDSYSVDGKTAKKLGRKEGKYLTLQTDADSDVKKALCYALKSFIPSRRKALIVGLGNGDVVADALGRYVVEDLKKYDLEGGRLSVFAPDVGALTNLDSAQLVKSVCEGFSPDCVIAVDALATAKKERLGTCYQFTDSCLRPGGGVGKGNYLDSAVLDTHFVAIGVPFIINATDMGADEDGYFVPYDADVMVKSCAKFIADAIYHSFS